MRYENEDELRTAVERRLKGKIPDEIWLENQPFWTGPYDEYDVGEIVSKLRNTQAQIIPRINNYYSAAMVRSELRLEEIEPIAEEYRQKIFGKDKPPFSNLESMRKWIRMEAKKQPPSDGYAPEFGYKTDWVKLSPEEKKKIKETSEKKPGQYGNVFKSLAIPEDNHVSRVVVSEGTNLDHLWWASKRISKIIDCHEADATAYILVGIPPLLQSISSVVEHRSVDMVEKSEAKVVITLRDPIPVKQFIVFYRNLLKQVWGTERGVRSPSERDIELVKFIPYRDVLKEKGWEDHRQEWNKHIKNKPEFIFNYWRGFREAYLRAYKRVYPLAPPMGFHDDSLIDKWRKILSSLRK